MRTFSSEGIILKRVDFGEADRLVTVFTKNKGKVTCLAKGIRRIESRRSGNVDLLNKAKLFFAESKSLPILTEAESQKTYKNLKKDLKKVGYAYYLAELVDQFFHDQQESYKTFELLSESLAMLDKLPLDKSENIVCGFEIKILSFTGYQPQLFNCVKCRRSLEPNGNLISPELGGVIDKSCARESIVAKPISPEAIKVLRFAQEKPLSEIAKLNIPEVLSNNLRSLMRFYLEYVLEKQIASADFSEKVKKLGG